jgi:hypothetical protein
MDYDSPWKEALDRFFRLFLLFFFPKVAARIDWSRDHEPLDTELRKVVRDAETGLRYIDRLVKVFRPRGESRLLHAEVQCEPEEGFERRMHVYNYRVEDVYGEPVLTLVVPGDDNPDWRPSRYVFEEDGCERTLTFLTVKLLDYENQGEALEDDANPFGLMVAAHLLARRTRRDMAARMEGKLRVLRKLRAKEMEPIDRGEWWRILDWLLELPDEMEREVKRLGAEAAKEGTVPRVSGFERVAYEEGLLDALETFLTHRFGADTPAFLSDLKKKYDANLLKAVHRAAVEGASLEELRKLLP